MCIRDRYLTVGKKTLDFLIGQTFENGMYNAMNMTTNTGIFEFCGIEVLDHVYFPSIMTVTDEIRSQYIEQAAEVISRLSPAVK